MKYLTYNATLRTYRQGRAVWKSGAQLISCLLHSCHKASAAGEHIAQLGRRLATR
jgi:hypothetical protein